MNYQRKRVAKRLASGLLAGALALGGLAISGGTASAKTPSSPTTQRIYGADRYSTAVAVARAQIATTGTPVDGFVIASGEAPYDALAASLLTTDDRPMVLVKKDSIPESVSDLFSDYRALLAAEVTPPRVYVVGGENAISKSVLEGITAALVTAGDTTPVVVSRVAGDDRYATAKAISDVTGMTAATDALVIVNGEDGKWADALSAGPFAADNGWPIVTTDSSGLQASAKAKVDAYLAMPGSVKQFRIIGGPASVSTKVEEYLIGTKGVAPEKIRRIGGADRYHTNFLVNVHMLGDTLAAAGGGTDFTTYIGDKVALASGESPWDAMTAASWAAENNVHVVLTPAAGGSTFAATLAGVLAGLSSAGTPGLGTTGGSLFIIGGKSAVSDAAKSAYIAAASSENGTGTSLTGCVAGSTLLTLSVPRLYAPESTSFVTNDNAWETASFKQNGNTFAAGNIDIAAFDTVGIKSRSVYLITVPTLTNAMAGQTITWAGMTEGVAVAGFTPTRSVAGASCTVTPDVTPPTVTMQAIPGNDGVTQAGQRFVLTASEDVVVDVDAGELDNVTTATDNAVDATNTLVSGVGAGKVWIVTLGAGEAAAAAAGDLSALTAGDVVTIASAAIVDINGNSPVLDITASAADDNVGPAISVGATECVSVDQGEWDAGFLSIDAVADGAYDGAAGNSYTLSVVNQRGLLSPSLVVDTTAKTITVTADTGYHTVADLETAMENSWIQDTVLGDLEITTVAGDLDERLSRTLTPDISVTGTTRCEVLLVGTESFNLATAGVVARVNGFSAPYVLGEDVTSASDAAYAAATPVANSTTSKVFQFDTLTLGAVTISFKPVADGGVSDSEGNATTSIVSFNI